MITEVGKYLRVLRAECGESLTRMAKRLSLSTSMLSDIETGKRNPSKDLAAKLQSAYGLDEAEIDRLQFAIARTNGEAKIDLEGLPHSDAELAIRLAMAFPRLEASQKLAMEEILDTVPLARRESGGAIIELADRSTKTVPSGTVVLNPDRVKECGYLYIAWFFNEEEPAGPIEALQGAHVGPLYAFASTRGDLHKYGTTSPSFESETERMACSQESLSLIEAMLLESPSAYSKVAPSQSLRFSWVDVDHAFDKPARVGTSATVSRL